MATNFTTFAAYAALLGDALTTSVPLTTADGFSGSASAPGYIPPTVNATVRGLIESTETKIKMDPPEGSAVESKYRAKGEKVGRIAAAMFGQANGLSAAQILNPKGKGKKAQPAEEAK